MRSSVTGSGWFVGTRHENYGRTRNTIVLWPKKLHSFAEEIYGFDYSGMFW